MKTIRRVLCLLALLALASFGMIACSKEQAKTEADAVKSCLASPKVLDCQISVIFLCDEQPCTGPERVARTLQCVTDCMKGE